MTSQSTKFIDVTRTFIPVDPNAFPDSLHVKETPEERVPVMAYRGYNFLPTAYGYRSFFGLGQSLGIDAIAERVDHVFIFQNNSYENILIALCDSGIWYKAADVAGAWVQALVLPDYRESQVHYMWTYCIINDALYCYRQNGPSYQKFVSSATAPGFTMTSVVPNFLNMAAQQGIFRAGARLGFWDSADSTAWSNLDDFADFTPSIETLANATTFSSVVGRIVTIKSHGEGFMIYATKSAVYVAEQPESLFQWDPTRILDVAGIAYPHEVEAGVPDSVHYVYTNVGLYRIKNASPEVIVPEVTDYFKLSSGPKYLKLLEGRYLAVQTLDPNYINGLPQFSDEEIPATTITFPGANLNLLDAIEDAQTAGGGAFCPIFSGLGSGAFSQPVGEDPSVVWRPIYTAYLSGTELIKDTVTWKTTPCNVTNLATSLPFGMTPDAPPSEGEATGDDTKKKVVTGAEAYVDGNWTIERFVAAQSAIWKTQESQLASVLGQILGRTHVSTKTEESGSNINFVTTSSCDIGRYALAYSGYQFGFSKCQFFLRRFVTAVADLKVKKTERCTSVFVPANTIPRPILGWFIGVVNVCPAHNTNPACTGPDSIVAASPEAAYNACPTRCTTVGPGTFALFANDEWGRPYQMFFGGTYGADAFVKPGDCPPGYTITGTKLMTCSKASFYQNNYQNTAYIDTTNVQLPPIPDIGFCKLTGWKDIVSGTKIAAATCDAPTEFGEDGESGPPPVSDKGSVCSQPFEPFIIPGTPAVTVNWPDHSVTIPSGSFFLQDGSAAPLYPTFEGAWVYDIHLEKWGVYKGRHKQLLDYSPINSYGPSKQSYSRFGIMGGILAEGGKLYLFDSFPTDSKITYGKIGYYRQGTTTVQEAHVSMRTPCDCSVTVETSLYGKNLTAGLTKTMYYVAETSMAFYGGYAGRWHNITIEGRFDISYLEFRGIVSGKR